MTEYSVWLLDHATGDPLALIDEFDALNYTHIVNGVGAFSLVLPVGFDTSFLQTDTRVAVWRKPNGGAKYLDFVGLHRYLAKDQRGAAIDKSMAGPDLNDLLRRRIVAYAAGTAQAEKTDQADDMMKAFVRQNLGSSAIAARDLSAYGFTVQADVGAGTSISKAAAWRNLLDTLKEVADDSHTTEATCIYFGIVPLNNGWECEFRTNATQWGVDHRFPSGAAGPVVFSLEYGNIDTVSRNTNRRDEVTYAYAGGQGEESVRIIQEASDTVRIGESPFNRCEAFFDARNGGTTAAYTLAEAQAGLRNGRPREIFSGAIIASGTSQVYGRDYGFGDYVTAVFQGEQIDCRIEAVTISVSGAKEDVEIQLRSEQ